MALAPKPEACDENGPAVRQLPGVRGGRKPWSVPRLRGRGKQGNTVMHT
jgi:hypothetical protein